MDRTEPVATGRGLATLVVAIAHRLRAAGVGVGTGEVLLGIEAAAAVGIDERTTLMAALRACWCRSREDQLRFEAMAVGIGGPVTAPSPVMPHPLAAGQAQLHLAAADDRASASRGEGPRRRGRRLVPSDRPGLGQVDFGRCTPAELAELAVAIGRLRTGAPQRRGRRHRSARRGPAIDWGRSRRAALRADGEWLQLHRRRPRPRPRPLLVLCDVSGSMERYARLLLRFCHAAGQGPTPVEVFVFSTGLSRISRQLRHRDPSVALAAAGTHAVGWSGGTHIADAVHQLCTRWGPRVLSGRPITLLISDGWETGPPERLAAELGRLRRSSWRLVWGNPLMGDPGFAPTARGMQAALPNVDVLHPVHNLESLEQLATMLRGSAERRERTVRSPGAGPSARRG